jgi:hypothetical protein
MERIKQLVFQTYEHVRQFYFRMSTRIKTLRLLYIYRLSVNQYLAVIKY